MLIKLQRRHLHHPLHILFHHLVVRHPNQHLAGLRVLYLLQNLALSVRVGGRPWLVWDAEFKREYVGDMPTEMFLHFFKSFSDSAKINLNIKAEGDNEHHKIEGIFKALARSLQMAIRRDIHHFQLPSSKGVL